jgi:hypothetical protein
MMTFPPLPHRRHGQNLPHKGVWTSDDSDSDFEDILESDANAEGHSSRPHSPKHRQRISRKNSAEGMRSRPRQGSSHKDNEWISTRNLLDGVSSYVRLDKDRMSALSPATKASFKAPLQDADNPASPLEQLPGHAQARLPNTYMHFNIRTLNLHLALRTKEILACSEAMWEWIQDYQKKGKGKSKNPTEGNARGRSDSLQIGDAFMRGTSVSVESSGSNTQTSLSEMTRQDFDNLLTMFDLYVIQFSMPYPHHY